MSGILWDALMFLCAVGPLIIFHELGHYWVGRWCGVRAETFSIGFGREVAGWTDNRGTRWKIGWLPLGGFVKFAGEYELDGTPSPRQPQDGFEAQALWRRALIVAAGPMANFLLAALIYMAFVAKFGVLHIGTEIGVIEPGSVAATAGFKAGDDIRSINGQPMDDFEAIRDAVMARAGQTVTVTVLRTGHLLDVQVVPRAAKAKDRYGIEREGGHLGIGPVISFQPVPWYQWPQESVRAVWLRIKGTAAGIGMILTGQIAPSQLGGTLQVAKVAGDVAKSGWMQLVELAAFISINLGFMNLLPIPVLDGGHLALYGVEAVRRKPLTAATRETVFRAGLVMLMTLFVFVTINDLGSFGVWKQLAGLIGWTT